MVILGIDPGYAIVGFGVVDYHNNHFTVLDYGAVTTEANTDFSGRLEAIYDGILAAPGEVYGYCEGANGELGYYIVSEGKKYPTRVKVRPPCYNIYQAYPEMIKGTMIADAVAMIGGLNVIAGELDR